ncbi:rRNA maturation RNase YbeY [bacterium]|nr:rRNA maturation RNase YbeY [bacterium]
MDSVQVTYDEHLTLLGKDIENLIEKKTKKILKKLGVKKQYISLYFCSAKTIKKLNSEYRNKNTPTDVLSWSYQDDGIDVHGDSPWGELALCLEVIEKQAENSGWPLETELLRLLVHGIGHLNGFDHELSEAKEEEMLRFEEELLSFIGLEGIYST